KGELWTNVEDPFLNARVMSADRVAPMVVYLASKDCELTHQNYSACGGRFARVFVGLSEGWVGVDGENGPTADDGAGHVSEISAVERFIVPMSGDEEMARVRRQLGSA